MARYLSIKDNKDNILIIRLNTMINVVTNDFVEKAVFLPLGFLFLWRFMLLNLFFIIPMYYKADLDFSILIIIFSSRKKSYFVIGYRSNSPKIEGFRGLKILSSGFKIDV